MRAESCRSAQLGKTTRATDQAENVPCGPWGHARWGAAWEAERVFSGKKSKWACDARCSSCGCGSIIGGPTLSQGAWKRSRPIGRCWISDTGRVSGWASRCADAMGLHDRGKFDETIEDKGVKVLTDPRALMHVDGTKMDYVEDWLRKYSSEFCFHQP